jgi:hypothetical protein
VEFRFTRVSKTDFIFDPIRLRLKRCCVTDGGRSVRKSGGAGWCVNSLPLKTFPTQNLYRNSDPGVSFLVKRSEIFKTVSRQMQNILVSGQSTRWTVK